MSHFLANVVACGLVVNWCDLMTNAQLFLIIEDVFGKKMMTPTKQILRRY